MQPNGHQLAAPLRENSKGIRFAGKAVKRMHLACQGQGINRLSVVETARFVLL